MLSCTFREYEDSYKANLTAYLKEYEDYTPTSFLEIELNNYTNYYNSLIKISDYFKNKTIKDLRVNSAITGVIADLKKINEPVFNEIFTIGKTKTVFDEDEYEGMLILGTIPPSIDINFKKLTNRIASANRIIVFISEQLTISRSPNKNATSIYLTGELPLGTIKQQSVVPGNAIAVNAGANVKPEKVEVTDQGGFNEYTKSTIEDYLVDIVDDINPNDYKILVDALYSYFTTGEFPILKRQIMFKSVNKKKVGWALKEAYKNVTLRILDIEYFRFAKDNINLFSEEVIENDAFRQSKFYKLFTTKPVK